jgi:hypothetical protein
MLQVLDTLIVVVWYAFVVLGSLAMLIRISRGKRSYPGQLGALPEKWVRWMLGEQPQQRR